MIEATAADNMDRMYRLQRHIYDLTRRYYLLGRTTMIEDLAPPARSRIVEIGCGTGWNLVRAAGTYPACAYYGFDVSPAMLDTARTKIAAAGLERTITLAAGDATAFTCRALFGIAAADRIFASYVLSMIPDWKLAMSCAVEQLSDGGSLHIIDFGPGHGLPAPFRKSLHTWLAAFHVTPRVELEAEVDYLARTHDLVTSFELLYGGYAQHAVLRRA